MHIHAYILNIKVTRPLYTTRNKHRDTGRRRLIGCLILQVIFRKRATNYRALLRKMTYEDKANMELPLVHKYVCIYVCIYI